MPRTPTQTTQPLRTYGEYRKVRICRGYSQCRINASCSFCTVQYGYFDASGNRIEPEFKPAPVAKTVTRTPQPLVDGRRSHNGHLTKEEKIALHTAIEDKIGSSKELSIRFNISVRNVEVHRSKCAAKAKLAAARRV